MIGQRENGYPHGYLLLFYVSFAWGQLTCDCTTSKIIQSSWMVSAIPELYVPHKLSLQRN